jgi:hypothetical protein
MEKTETPKFSAYVYWSSHAVKKWVVQVSNWQKTETRYVAAIDEDGAIRGGINASFLNGHLEATARLATPDDLGCVLVHTH